MKDRLKVCLISSLAWFAASFIVGILAIIFTVMAQAGDSIFQALTLVVSALAFLLVFIAPLAIGWWTFRKNGGGKDGAINALVSAIAVTAISMIFFVLLQFLLPLILESPINFGTGLVFTLSYAALDTSSLFSASLGLLCIFSKLAIAAGFGALGAILARKFDQRKEEDTRIDFWWSHKPSKKSSRKASGKKAKKASSGKKRKR